MIDWNKRAQELLPDLVKRHAAVITVTPNVHPPISSTAGGWSITQGQGVTSKGADKSDRTDLSSVLSVLPDNVVAIVPRSLGSEDIKHGIEGQQIVTGKTDETPLSSVLAVPPDPDAERERPLHDRTSGEECPFGDDEWRASPNPNDELSNDPLREIPKAPTSQESCIGENVDLTTCPAATKSKAKKRLPSDGQEWSERVEALKTEAIMLKDERSELAVMCEELEEQNEELRRAARDGDTLAVVDKNSQLRAALALSHSQVRGLQNNVAQLEKLVMRWRRKAGAAVPERTDSGSRVS